MSMAANLADLHEAAFDLEGVGMVVTKPSGAQVTGVFFPKPASPGGGFGSEVGLAMRLSQQEVPMLHLVEADAADLSSATPRLQQTLPQMAAAVMALVRPARTHGHRVRGNHWGLGTAVGDPQGLSAQPSEFSPALNGRDSWIVRWNQAVYLDDALPF